MQTETAIVLGAAAVAGVGAVVYVLTRPKPPQAAPTPAPASAAAPTPAPPAPLPTTVQELAAKQEAERLERERVQRDMEIRGFIDRIANVENRQLIVLSQIEAVQRDNSRLNDFIQEAFMDLTTGPAWQEQVTTCERTVRNNCGFDLFGACWGANGFKCGSREADFAWGNPAAQMLTKARNDVGPQKLELWKSNQRRPFEASLMELEVQYRGMVAELKSKYGVNYTPAAANAHTTATALLGR